MDLLMVRDRTTGRFVYTEQLQRRQGETPWEYVRRSVRREGQLRDRFDEKNVEVIVGWGTGSVDEFLRANPEYASGERAGGRHEDGRLEGGKIDQ